MTENSHASSHHHVPSHVDHPEIHSLTQEDSSEDASKILVICRDKNLSTPKSILFWLKLQGHHVYVANTQEKAVELLHREEFSAAFVDIAQLDSFSSTIFPVALPPNNHLLLIGFSSKDEDETTTLPFGEEKEFAKRHGVHYYFPDPLEEKELLEWMLLQRKTCSNIEQLCKMLDEDIRLNAFHDRGYIPVENRHHHEVSDVYAHHIEDQERSLKLSSPRAHEGEGVLGFIQAQVAKVISPRAGNTLHGNMSPR